MHHFAELVIFIGVFLVGTALLQETSKRFKFPYTVALLLLGLATRQVFHFFHLPFHIELPPDFTFYLLLPVLLFGAAMHINIHQFKIQFKTISFVATFGLMVSVAVVGVLVSYLLGLPIGVGLLFGALISATDPIAVLAIFKTLGAPKRLSLLADGESMFNDATAVILFRIISTVVVTGAHIGEETIISNLGIFLYVFLGSIAAGLVIGYVLSSVLAKIKNDVLVETTLAVGVAFLSFAGTEHFFHLSGVITSVIAGLITGNLGRSRFSAGVIHFMHDFWDYLGYLAISAVFFFATFSLDISIFGFQPESWMIAVLSVLIARAISVYSTFFITNRLPIFKDEPNVPMSWQHILNWGGLRGVIPLVLVFSLPDTFSYKQDLFVFTFATLLFTLLINGITVELLLKKLGLNKLSKDEEILSKENTIFSIERAKQVLAELPKNEFAADQLKQMRKQLDRQEKESHRQLLEIANEAEIEHSLRLHAIDIQRQALEQLFRDEYITEGVWYDFDAELDLQQDALEYPETYVTRAISKDGKVHSRKSFRRRLLRLREISQRLPILKKIIRFSKDQLIQSRYSQLKARILTSTSVLSYLEKVKRLFPNDEWLDAPIQKVSDTHLDFINRNKKELVVLEHEYSHVVEKLQSILLEKLIRKSFSQDHN